MEEWAGPPEHDAQCPSGDYRPGLHDVIARSMASDHVVPPAACQRCSSPEIGHRLELIAVETTPRVLMAAPAAGAEVRYVAKNVATVAEASVSTPPDNPPCRGYAATSRGRGMARLTSGRCISLLIAAARLVPD